MRSRVLRPALFFAVCCLLVACRQQAATATPTARPLGGSAATPTAEATSSPTVLPTPSPTPLALRAFRDEFADLSLQIPVDWIVGTPSQIALGTLYQLGPEPLGPGPVSSAMILVDTRDWDAQATALQLECGADCGERQLSFQPVTIGKYAGQKAIIGSNTETPLEWFFLAHNGRLVALTLHDPHTLQTLEQVVASLELGAPTPTPTGTAMATGTPTMTPLPSVTPPPSQTPAPTASRRSEGPTETAIDFLASLTADPSGDEAHSFLSDELGRQTVDGTGLLALLAIDPAFSRFEVAWTSTVGRLVNYDVTIIYRDATVQRQIILVFEAEEWRVDQIILPPEPTPAPDPGTAETPTPGA